MTCPGLWHIRYLNCQSLFGVQITYASFLTIPGVVVGVRYTSDIKANLVQLEKIPVVVVGVGKQVILRLTQSS